jgi:hypothetical protein
VCCGKYTSTSTVARIGSYRYAPAACEAEAALGTKWSYFLRGAEELLMIFFLDAARIWYLVSGRWPLNEVVLAVTYLLLLLLLYIYFFLDD